jgi:hypothetical protein
MVFASIFIGGGFSCRGFATRPGPRHDEAGHRRQLHCRLAQHPDLLGLGLGWQLAFARTWHLDRSDDSPTTREAEHHFMRLPPRPNKITGANEGGLHWFAVRALWAPRIAQFCRWAPQRKTP